MYVYTDTFGYFVRAVEPWRGAPNKCRLIDWLIDCLIDWSMAQLIQATNQEIKRTIGRAVGCVVKVSATVDQRIRGSQRFDTQLNQLSD